ncbi:MAG: peptidylprolyl isomerase [Saprospiraceae bacterium]|nr:peptidylprolyl isomerase [Saprospiraceae bacterium]
MALIGKIRKNFWLVLILLAMALASFILMDVMGSRKGGGRGMFNQTLVGKVAGQKIDYMDFEKTERALYSGSNDVYGRRTMLWNYLVEKALVEKQVSALGLGVSRDELMELQFGNNLSSVIQNNFRDPNTGQVNRQQLLQFKQAMETGQELSVDFRNFWAEQEKQIVKTALQDKINNMVMKAMIVPKWQTEVVNQLNNDKLTMEFVRVGFDKVPDTEIKLTDEDYKNFMAKTPGKYTIAEETRTVDYATFNVAPTTADSVAIHTGLEALKAEFNATNNDSLFAATNGGGLSPAYSKITDITGSLKDSLPSMAVGSVVGPFAEGANYLLAKLVDKRVLPDSVKARHILKKASDPVQLASANKSIDSLKNLIASGAMKFDSVAIRNSDDTGSAIKGGDLGTFAQGTMVKPFNDVCFITGTTGKLYTVTTQFGVHLIEIQSQKYIDKTPKYQLAIIPAAIVPTQETQDVMYDKVTAILSKIKTTEDFKKAAEANPEILLQTSKSLKANDYSIPGFPEGETSRSIIKWAFENDKGDVSPVMYSYQDDVNFYTKSFVIAGVHSVNEAGMMSVEDAKASLELQVKNEKKAEILMGKIKAVSDLASLAGQYGTNVDTAANVSFSAAFIEAIQTSEPVVVAKAFGLEQGKISAPIKGNTGVFVLKVTEKMPAVAENSNLEMIKSSIVNSNKSGAGYRLWEALKKKFTPEDHRAKFF